MFNYLKNNLTYLIALLAALIAFWSGLVYRAYSLNNIGLGLSLALIFPAFIILLFRLKNKFRPEEATPKTPAKPWAKTLILYVILLSAFCFLLSVLINFQTASSIISPWQVVPAYFFAIYGFLTLILIIIANNSQFGIRHLKFIIPPFYFLSFSIALFVYKIGYGFDPFVHQATVDLIDKTGAVDPKPFYYLGQYGLIVILHKITAVSITHLDKFLVPLLAALTLPAALWQFLKKYFSDQKTNLLLVLAILILPFTFFIVTAPQNLSYLFLILTILYGLTCSSRLELAVVYIFALASLITQPIAGVPALFFALALTVYHNDKEKIKKWLYALIFILSSVAIPVLFVILNNQNKPLSGFAGHLEALPIPDKLKFTIPNQENFILNFIYLYAFNLKFIIAILILAGIFLCWRHREHSKIFFLNLLLAVSLLISYFLAKQISFDFLIDYEQGDFAQRILFTAIIFCLPFILITLYWLIDKILKQKIIVKIPWLAFFIILITTSLYVSYPRYDRYFNSRGYAVSQQDIDAVRWIEDNAQGDYIVLANQQTSAAALREFGFNRYYELANSPLSRDDRSGGESAPSPLEEPVPSLSREEGQGEVYFYPIPTSSPLYQFYLDMVYKYPSKKTMLEAMESAGVGESYFVLNKYWWAFPKILEEAKLEADSWQELDDGEIYVFRYNK